MRATPSTTARCALAAALSVAALSVTTLSSVPAAKAEGSTCQGRAVTLASNTGTDGDDVIVTRDTETTGGAGNDLICIRTVPSMPSGYLLVDAGPGDDTVVNEIMDDTTVSVRLGTGADSYTGSDRASTELVLAGDYDRFSFPVAPRGADADVDTIDTGGGPDEVYSGTTSPGATNGDIITTGTGPDHVRWGGEQSGPPVDVGVSTNVLSLYQGLRGTAVRIDAPRRTVTADSRPVFRWEGNVARFVTKLDNREQSFIGTHRDDWVAIGGPAVEGDLIATSHYDNYGPAVSAYPSAGTKRSVSLGGGDDELWMLSPGRGEIDGGQGRDTLKTRWCARTELRLDDTYSCDPSEDGVRPFSHGVLGWEAVGTAGDRVSVVGTARRDRIRVNASWVRVRGLGGDDRINPVVRGVSRSYSVVLWGGPGADVLDGTREPDRLLGGSGDDVLLGRGHHDELRGGTGHDRAVGDRGHDRCDAEVRHTCELP